MPTDIIRWVAFFYNKKILFDRIGGLVNLQWINDQQGLRLIPMLFVLIFRNRKIRDSYWLNGKKFLFRHFVFCLKNIKILKLN